MALLNPIPFHLTVRTHAAGKGIRGTFGGDGLTSEVQPLFGSADPRARHTGHLTLWIHGYNNAQDDISETWQETARTLRALGCSLDDLVAFYWPGDQWSNQFVSALAYPKQVPVALSAAALLATYFADPRFTQPLQLTLIAHSLGCMVALEAVQALRKVRHIELSRLLLMAAAVPQGLCMQDEPPYGKGCARIEERALYSTEDRVLSYTFKIGQRVARRLGWAEVPSLRTAGGLKAVGGAGGPGRRWYPRAVPMTDFDHGHYWPHAHEEIALAMPKHGRRVRSHQPASHTAPTRSMANVAPRTQDASRTSWRGEGQAPK